MLLLSRLDAFRLPTLIMPSRQSRSFGATLIVALGLCFGLAPVRSATDDAPKSGVFVVQPILFTADQTPADFLDLVGQHTRARWRLLFRDPPPSPPADREHAALILGSLLGDSFLVWQAGDSQQFRNNNQDVLSYCRMLGLGEKLMPRLMAQGKMAEGSEWKELRHEIVDGHQELLRLLREQMDDDLALMIDLGLWLRVLEIASAIVAETPDADVRALCVGSPGLLQELHDDFSRISAFKREQPLVKRIGVTIDEVSLKWRDSEKTPPTQVQVAQTHEKIKALMQQLMAK